MMAMMQNIMIINETTTTKTVHIQQERIRRSLSEFQSIKFASNTESVSSHTDSWNMEDDQDLLQEVMRVQMIVDRFKITDTGAYSHGSINTLAHTHAGSIDTVIHAVHAACTNFDLKKLILDAKNSDTIITILELAGFESVASRLRYLKEITDEDTEDPPIDVESLRLSVLLWQNTVTCPSHRS